MTQPAAALPEPPVLQSKASRTRGRPVLPRGYRIQKGDIDPAHRAAFLDELRQLAMAGSTRFEMAVHFGVSIVTFNLWCQRDKDVAEAVDTPNAIADRRVEATLFQKATGYSYRSEEIKVIDNKVVRVPTITHVPPSDTAMIFWLKNRQRDKWRDQQNVEVSGSVEVKTDLRELALGMIATIKAGLLAAPNTIEGEKVEE